MSLRWRHRPAALDNRRRDGSSTEPWYTARGKCQFVHEERSLEEQTLARRIVEIASDKQASDIVLLDIRPVATVADYFVVMSTTSERQMSAVVRDLEDGPSRGGGRPAAPDRGPRRVLAGC